MPTVESLKNRYDDPYVKSERISISPERFERGVKRNDDGAWGVGALVVDDGRVLFVRENDMWLLPGGRLETDETPETGAIREVREETAVDIEVTGLGAIAEQTFVRGKSDEQYEFTFVTFLARPTADTPIPEAADDPIDEAVWRDSVPERTFDRDLVVRLIDDNR